MKWRHLSIRDLTNPGHHAACDPLNRQTQRNCLILLNRMHPHDRDDGYGTRDRFTHRRLLDVAIVRPVRVSTVAMVLLKRTAGSHHASVAFFRNRKECRLQRCHHSLE